MLECYSARKKNKILPFAEKWIEVEDIILGEINQTQKDKYHIFSFICGSLKIKSAQMSDSKIVIITGWEG
jgi:hypothetical protein